MQSAHERRKRHPVFFVALILALILIVLIILLILRPSSREIRVVDCPQPPRDAPQAGAGRYVEGQVIVVGAAGAIDEVMTAVANTVGPVLLAGCDVSYLAQLPATAGQAPANLFPRDALNTLAIRLYSIQQTTTVTEAVTAITTQGAGRPDPVYADPNYLTIGGALAGACGNPEGVGGSPEGVGGSPEGVGGSPSGLAAPASADTFLSQWAFEHIGLGETLHASYDAARVRYEGGRIRIGVFDTSPFTVTQVDTVTIQVGTPQTYPALSLTVYSSTLPTILRPAGVLTDVKDHGLFIAGLIHAVAPQSDIRLYPVLDQYGCGDLYTLVTRLHTFISQVGAERSALDGAVINLSLGVLKPRPTDVIEPLDVIDVLQRPTSSTAEVAYTALKTDPIESLLLTVRVAYDENIVVVAAAGNDSWREEYQTQPLSPQYPAAYPFVIGVAGSNANRQRSCFSNWGDVSAPAGEGASGQVVVSDSNAITMTISCAPSLATPLISVVQASSRFPLGYAKWNGTSFATPLVSGLAALTQEAGFQSTGWMDASDVAEAIKCGAATADGVINVPTTLLRCLHR